MAEAPGEIHFRTILLWHSQGRRKGDQKHKCCGKDPPPSGHRVRTCRKKGKSELVFFVLDSFANRNTWNFPFFRQVPSYSRIQTKGQKAGPHFEDLSQSMKMLRAPPVNCAPLLSAFQGDKYPAGPVSKKTWSYQESLELAESLEIIPSFLRFINTHSRKMRFFYESAENRTRHRTKGSSCTVPLQKHLNQPDLEELSIPSS